MSWSLVCIVIYLVHPAVAAEVSVRPCRLCCQNLSSCIYASDASKQKEVLHICCGSNVWGKYFCCPEKVGGNTYTCKGKTGKCKFASVIPPNNSDSETKDCVKEGKRAEDTNSSAAIIICFLAALALLSKNSGKAGSPDTGAQRRQSQAVGMGTAPTNEQDPSRQRKEEPKRIAASLVAESLLTQTVAQALVSRTTRSVSIDSIDFDFDIDADWG
jgi:hypothetical protein